MDVASPEATALAAGAAPLLPRLSWLRLLALYLGRLLLLAVLLLSTATVLGLVGVAVAPYFSEEWRAPKVEEDAKRVSLFLFALFTGLMSGKLLRLHSLAEQLSEFHRENGQYGQHNVKHQRLLRKQQEAVRDMTDMATTLGEVVPALAADQQRVSLTLENVTEEMKLALDKVLEAWESERQERARLQQELLEMRGIEERLRATVELLADGRAIEEGLECKMEEVLAKQQSVQREAKALQEQRTDLQREQHDLLEEQREYLEEQRRLSEKQHRVTDSLREHFISGVSCVSAVTALSPRSSVLSPRSSSPQRYPAQPVKARSPLRITSHWL